MTLLKEELFLEKSNMSKIIFKPNELHDLKVYTVILSNGKVRTCYSKDLAFSYMNRDVILENGNVIWRSSLW